jgi:hypothetical protein
VQGLEFSPEAFERRTFSFHEIPFVRIQVTPIRRSAQLLPLEAYILSQKWVLPLAPASWDLAVGWRAGKRVDPRGASILCDYLDTLDSSGNLVWLSWSQSHPTLAAVLWPIIARLARERLYEIIPEIMRLAAAADAPSPQQLQTNLGQQVAQRCMVLADYYSSAGQQEYARRLAKLALEFDPEVDRDAEPVQ